MEERYEEISDVIEAEQDVCKKRPFVYAALSAGLAVTLPLIAYCAYQINEERAKRGESYITATPIAVLYIVLKDRFFEKR